MDYNHQVTIVEATSHPDAGIRPDSHTGYINLGLIIILKNVPLQLQMISNSDETAYQSVNREVTYSN